MGERAVRVVPASRAGVEGQALLAMTKLGTSPHPGDLSVRRANLDDRETMFRIHVDAVIGLCATHYSKGAGRWLIRRPLTCRYTGAIEHGGD